MLQTVFGVIGSGNAPKSISKLMTAHKSNNNLRGDAKKHLKWQKLFC